MTTGTFTSAREVAREVLDEFDSSPRDAAALLKGRLDRTPNRGLAADLVFGVIRNRSCIDRVVHRISGVPAERIAPQIRNVLRTGVYELIYCPDRHDYAIVAEAMKQIDNAPSRQKGFVNAVLRKTCRSISDRSLPLKAGILRACVPVSPGLGCRFKSNIFDDPDKSAATWLSQAFSLPKWLTKGWTKRFGFAGATDICFASNRRPGIYLRPNPLRTDGGKLFDLLREADVDCEKVEDGSFVRVRSGRPIDTLPGFAEGLFSVQDTTASLAASLLAPRPEQRALDLCAAPGGKTVQMAELMNDTGSIIATDIDEERLDMVASSVGQLCLGCVSVVPHSELAATVAEHGPFDAVLLDVPCSNTGVMARRPEVRYRLKRNQLSPLLETQRGLLEQGAGYVAVGGQLCYSTCSIEPSENNEMVEAFLAERPEFSLLCEKLVLPGIDPFDHDGGYAAVLLRNPGPQSPPPQTPQ